MLLKTTSRHSGEKFYLRKFWFIIISLALISILLPDLLLLASCILRVVCPLLFYSFSYLE